jgi:hypothetical protein
MTTIEELEAALKEFQYQIDSLRYVLNFANEQPNKTLGTVINATFHQKNGKLVTTYQELENLYDSKDTIRSALKQAIEIKRGDKVVVPREPTQGFPSMAMKGAVTMWDVTEQGTLIGHPQATAVYKAMITAAQEAADEK